MKSIKKRVLTILTLVLTILIIVPSFGYSFFYFFNDSIDQSGIDQTIDSNKDASTNHSGIDDIKENHSGSASEDIIYEIYFFPSTFYTEQYYQYLHRNEITLPTLSIDDGYNFSEISYKENNGKYTFSYTYDVGSGQVFYEEEFNLELASIFDTFARNELGLYDFLPEECFGYYDYDSNTLFKESEYLNKTKIDANVSGDEAYNTLLANQTNSKFSTSSTDKHYNPSGNYDVSTSYTTDPGLKYDWRTYKQDDLYSNNTPNDFRFDDINSYSISRRQFQSEYGHPDSEKVDVPSGNNWGNKWRFRNDRLGSWDNKSFGSGRYLPIKIEVTNSMTQEEFESLELTPQTDAGDIYDYYNFTFSGWGYFNENNEFSIERTTSLMENSISSADAFGLYDIMENLSSFVGNEDNIRVENGKTIYTLRFFPIFNNGKTYEETNEMSLGRRDPVYLKVDDNEEVYFTYGTNSGDAKYNEIPINYGYANNISIKKTNDNDYGKLAIKGSSIVNHDFDWYGSHWHDLINKNTNFKQYLIENYGEGLFNFYFFVVSPNVIVKEYNNINKDDIINTFDKLDAETFKNALNFSSLAYKDIHILTDLSIYSTTENNGTVPFICDGAYNPGDKDDEDHNFNNNGKEKTFYLLGIEKVLETKFISGLNIDQDIKEQADNKFNSSPSMQKINNDVYLLENSINKDNFTIGSGVEESHQIISDFNFDTNSIQLNNLINNDQIYVIRNIDFTNYSSLNEAIFQIKLYKEDDTSKIFNFNNPYSDTSSDEKIEFKEESYNSIYIKDNSGNNGGSLYIPASYYFNIEEQEISSQRYYKPRHTAYLGMYDFILYYDGTNYELYCNRHYNVSVKVFEKNPTHGSDGYADDTRGGKIIYERQAFVGSYANESDIGKNGLSFTETINNYLISNNKANGTYYIKDHVTGFKIFKIEKSGDSVNVSRVVESFRIRKNFYFYLDYEG